MGKDQVAKARSGVDYAKCKLGWESLNEDTQCAPTQDCTSARIQH
jgi:hypothetical protein